MCAAYNTAGKGQQILIQLGECTVETLGRLGGDEYRTKAVDETKKLLDEQCKRHNAAPPEGLVGPVCTYLIMKSKGEQWRQRALADAQVGVQSS